MASKAMSSMLEPWRPKNFRYRWFILTLAIAIVGAACFAAVHWPLAWMIGPMVFCAIAALARVPVSGPTVIRPPALVLVGVALGASFSPALIASIPTYFASIVLLLLLLVASVSCCYLYFRLVGKMSPSTAFFAAMPGGLNEMILLSEQHKADTRAVALIQTSRVVFVIVLIPILIRFDRPFDAVAALPVTNAVWSFGNVAVLLGCAAVGVVLGRLARLPASYLLGPMIVSGIVHGFGWTTAVLPPGLTSGAQLLLGLALGCSFAGIGFRFLGTLLVQSLGGAAILVGFAWLFAQLGARFLHAEFVPLLLAYAPGGVAEMSLAALALKVEPAIVAIHHVLRLMVILLFVRPIHAALTWSTRGRT